MKDILMKIISWIRSVMSESDGSGSTTRVLIFGLVIAAIAWSSILCFDAHKHKITVEQFNSYLSSIGQYLTVTATPLYAVNKTADVFNNKNKQSGQNGN